MNPTDTTRPTDSRGPQQSRDERLEEAFLRWQHELLGMLFFLVGHREDARDALQEAFFKCWRRRDGLDEVQNLRAWIFQVTLNVGRDMRATAWRRRRRPLEDEDAMTVASQIQPDDAASRAEQVALVRRALVDLRPEEQEVFLLRQNGQMTYEEIAAAIRIPLGTVKTRMRMAIGKLKAALEPRLE